MGTSVCRTDCRVAARRVAVSRDLLNQFIGRSWKYGLERVRCLSSGGRCDVVARDSPSTRFMDRVYGKHCFSGALVRHCGHWRQVYQEFPSAKTREVLEVRVSESWCGGVSGVWRGGKGVRRLPKLRKVCKWTGLVLSVLLFAVWVGSVFAQIQWTNTQGNTSFGLSGGGITYFYNSPNLPIQSRGISIEFRRVTLNFSWDAAGYPRITSCFLPAWPLLLILAVPTALAWLIGCLYSKRLNKSECASCGYDIRGLEVCPECGMKRL